MVFSQFRSQYPQGSIVTEMLSRIDGLHAFRVTIKDNDIILSTATAVDPDLEIAEDRAIKRALNILGIAFESSYDIQATLMPQTAQPLLKNSVNSDERILEPIRGSLKESVIEPIGEPINELINEPLDELINYEADKKYTTKYDESTKPTKVEQFKQEPIDLSNQLSQIMVEMERIGWTKQQGKEHLQRKYKNSRDQLSASEVFDF